MMKLHPSALFLLSFLVPAAFGFTVENCGNNQKALSDAVIFAQGLPWRSLMDLKLVGIKSTHGFKAMYKTMQPILYIQSIMDNVLQAAPVTISTQSLAPRFICASPDAGQKYMLDLNPWARCLEDSSTSYSSFWVEGTAVVMVCPAFFSLRLVPPIGPGAPGDLYCPIVHNNQFIGQSDPLIRYQNYDLLREMVRMYMGGYALGPETRPKEVMDWNECVGLRPYRSCAWNVMNLVYYTAFVVQGCTQFPDPVMPPFPPLMDLGTNVTIQNSSA